MVTMMISELKSIYRLKIFRENNYWFYNLGIHTNNVSLAPKYTMTQYETPHTMYAPFPCTHL